MLEERVCPQCGKKYQAPTEYCEKDRTPLSITNTLVGMVLDKRYRLDSVLGVGGMGVVYRATHIGFRKEFAVKVLRPDKMEKEGMLGRFQTEAIAAGKIDHPKAVKVTDFGVTEDRLAFLVMEIVEGTLLSQLIGRGGMDFQRAIEILCQVCEAVHAAHQKNIIHRDLKPDNIIVRRTDNEDHVKVLDFGIAKLREIDPSDSPPAPPTKVGTLIGTPLYMSPEQCKGIRGEDLKPTSDIYCLGIIAYEMLCGRTPFITANNLELINFHVNEPPPSLRLFAPTIPFSIERVVMQALDKNPDARPQTADGLARQLRIAVREAIGPKSDPNKQVVTMEISGPSTAAPLSTLENASDSRYEKDTLFIESPSPNPAIQEKTGNKSRRLKLALAAAILVLALGGAVLYLVFKENPPRPATNTLPAQISDEFGKMVLITGGKFTMGNDEGDEDERPAREEEVPPFYLDMYEVTNQQYKKFVDDKGYRKPEHWITGSYLPEEASLPVTHVTWGDAKAYAEWAKKRLPTEKEWEYAARGGKNNYLYPWGNQFIEGSANVNSGKEKPIPVGSFDKDVSSFGVYDMAGNVSEWVVDKLLWYGTTRPRDMNCAKCRVCRGGNFGKPTQGNQITNTYRLAFLPDLPQDAESKEEYRSQVFPFVGFRCAKDITLVK